MVVSPCCVLLAFCEQGGKGAGQHPSEGTPRPATGAANAPLFFISAGANHQLPIHELWSARPESYMQSFIVFLQLPDARKWYAGSLSKYPSDHD